MLLQSNLVLIGVGFVLFFTSSTKRSGPLDCFDAVEINAKLTPIAGSLVAATRTIPRLPALMGAIIGAYSHVLLDSIMHSDIRPFAPFSENNPALLAVSIGELHLYCVVAGLFGSVGLGFWWLISKERA